MSSLKKLAISNNPLDSKAKSVLKQLKKKGVNVRNLKKEKKDFKKFLKKYGVKYNKERWG